MNIRSLLYLAVACLLFAAAGPVFLKNESQMEVYRKPIETNMVQPGIYRGTENLAHVSGDQIVGMVTYALAGDFPLTIDGILINASTDISAIDLSGVPGLTYMLVVNRDSFRNILSVTANKI